MTVEQKYKVTEISNASIVEMVTLTVLNGPFFGPHCFEIPASFLPDKRPVVVGNVYLLSITDSSEA